ncbi:MAG: GNAT family N-acetyltransferase, partial [Candidatus Dormiibacterota bacterium]
VYERESVDIVQATEASLRETLFSASPTAFAHLAVHEDSTGSVVAGMAVWYLSFSTWTGRNGIYLEDLFVRETFRGHGYGKALLAKLAQMCVARGYPRFEWSVLNWNEPSIRFYQARGAVAADDWTRYRLEGAPMRALAESV